MYAQPQASYWDTLRNTHNPGWRESEFIGYTLFLLFFCPSTQGKASTGSNGHVYSMPSDGRKSVCNAGDLGSFPGLGRSSGEGNGYSLQYSYLEKSMNRGGWRATVYGVAKSWTQLNGQHFHFHFSLKANASHFLILLQVYGILGFLVHIAPALFLCLSSQGPTLPHCKHSQDNLIATDRAHANEGL